VSDPSAHTLRSLAERPDPPALPSAPEISVVVHSFRQAAHIRTCIEAVLAQVLPDAVTVEVLLADDGSDDGTVAILEEYAKARPGLFRPLFNVERTQYPPPCTPGRWTLIRAITEARGRYVAFIDGDDQWTDPDKLHLQWQRMEAEPDAALCVHNGHDAYADGRRVDYVRARFGRTELPERFTTADLLGVNLFPKGAYFFRRDRVPVDHTPLREAPALDWALAILLAERGPLAFIDRSMCDRNVHEAGIMGSKDSLKKVDWNLRQLALNERITSGRYRAELEHLRIALHKQALGIAVGRGDRTKGREHLNWLRRHKALPLRNFLQQFVVLNVPALSRLYFRLRTANP
jgi:glycosyltransferase involved in cell wall biosynthesis